MCDALAVQTASTPLQNRPHAPIALLGKNRMSSPSSRSSRRHRRPHPVPRPARPPRYLRAAASDFFATGFKLLFPPPGSPPALRPSLEDSNRSPHPVRRPPHPRPLVIRSSPSQTPVSPTTRPPEHRLVRPLPALFLINLTDTIRFSEAHADPKSARTRRFSLQPPPALTPLMTLTDHFPRHPPKGLAASKALPAAHSTSI